MRFGFPSLEALADTGSATTSSRALEQPTRYIRYGNSGTKEGLNSGWCGAAGYSLTSLGTGAHRGHR